MARPKNEVDRLIQDAQAILDDAISALENLIEDIRRENYDEGYNDAREKYEEV